jgi:L-ascorbate metabolism protein UlaG (beta-lactamase superfamily)
VAERSGFLRPDAVCEPLVDGFYAWLLNVAPVQAAMNLAFVQVPMLESFLNSPDVHAEASVNPELRGGFFVNIGLDRVERVAQLLAAIRRDRARMLEFAAAIAEGEALLRDAASGFSLSGLYERLPKALSGLVELVYDTGNQASMRFMEPVVYASAVHDRGRQSLQLSVESGVERPFVLSTPRLRGDAVLDIDVPFRERGLDELFGARVRPVSAGRLGDVLGLDGAQVEALGSLLTDDPGLSAERHITAGARIRYFGHACLVMQTPTAAVVTDPWVSADVSASGRYTWRDFPDFVDLVLLTHGHQDHVVLETLLALRGRVGAVVVPRCSRGNLADPSLALFIEELGFPVVEVDDFSRLELPGGSVTATPFLGEHADLDIRAKTTYCVELGGRRMFVGADSSGIERGLYREIRSFIGRVDVAFLGMECAGAPLTWLYGGLLTTPVSKRMSDSRTLSGSNAQQAGVIVEELGAEEVYIYAMGEEAWLVGHVMATSYSEDSYQLQQVDEFMQWCAGRGVKADHLYGQHEWRW